jgi:hypothetical protein
MGMRPAILQTDTLNQVAWQGSSRAPHFETFQLYLAHPTEPLAVALLFRLSAALPRGFGEVEAILLEPGKPPRRASQRWPLGRMQSDPERAGIGIAENSLQHNASTGLVRGDDFAISWDVHLADEALGYAGMPALWPGVTPKLYTPHPSSRVLRGKIEVWEGLSRHVPMRRLDVVGWHGMQGHWVSPAGTTPYAWVHSSQFDGHDGDPVSFEAFAGSAQLGPLRPSAMVGRLLLGGQTYRFDGWRNLWASAPEATSTGWSFAMQGKQAKLRGSVRLLNQPPVLSTFTNIDGQSAHQQLSMLAGLELIVEPRHGLPQTLISQRATYVLQTAAAPAAAPAATPVVQQAAS